MGHKNKQLLNRAGTCSPPLVKPPWGRANPLFWNVGRKWTDSIASNLLLVFDSYPFQELEIMCLGIDSLDLLRLWLPYSLNLPHFFLWWSIPSEKFLSLLEQTFARVLITLVLCILSQFLKLIDPLSDFSHTLTKCLNVLSVKCLVSPLLKTDFSPMDELFVTFTRTQVNFNRAFRPTR